ncbi:MAG: polysaccharide deacetylase family protein [Alphaproteobacteria bacterium]|nr:polysaccharide deacetylase family protein [Alphaproteobacteria bacterium]
MRLEIVFAAVTCMAVLPAWASGTADRPEELAWFQAHTIFHSGLRNGHEIALTFDDGPNAYTTRVLDVLKANNVKATFFIVGKMAKAHPDILARIAAEGHLLANHSASHPELTSSFDADPSTLINQLRIVHNEIAPLMKPTDKFYFRAPYGYWRSAHAQILNDDPVLRNYVGPIYWDVGGDISMHDGYVMSAADWDCWRHKWTPQICAKGYLREIRRDDGGVVLMHCIHRQSADLVASVVPPMLQEGYRFVRLDEVPEYRQYETPQSAPAVAWTPLTPTTKVAELK